MLRTYYYMAIIAIMFAVRSSEAINCTQAFLSQNFTQDTLDGANTIAGEYGSLTQAQILQSLYDEFNGTLVSASYNVTTVGSNTFINYEFVFGCDNITVTILPDGTQQTTKVASTVNKTTVQNSAAAAVADLTNAVSLLANQKQAGASGTTCTLKAGTTQSFVFTINITSQSYSSALSTGSLKTASDLQNALVSFFRTQFNANYPNQIANLTFVSQQSSASWYNLTFEVFFTSQITLATQRTQIAATIQQLYYNCLTTYFSSTTKTANIPKSVNISTPAVSTSCKKAIILTSANTSQLTQSGSLLNLTKVTSTSTAKINQSSKTSLTSTSSKTVSVQTSGSGSQTSTDKGNVGGGSNATKGSSSTGSAGISSSSTNTKTATSSKAVNDTLGGQVSITAKSGSGTSASNTSAKSSETSSGSTGTKTVTSSKAVNDTLGGQVSITAKSGSGTSGSSTSEKSSGASSGSSGTKTVTSSKAVNDTLGGQVSITAKSGSGTSGSSTSEKSSGASSSSTGTKTVTSSKAVNDTLGGQISIPSKSSSGASASNTSAKSSGTSSSSTGTKTVTSSKEVNATLGGQISIPSKSSSGASASNTSAKSSETSSGSTGTKTVASSKEVNATLGGQISIPSKSSSGASASNTSAKSSGTSSSSTGTKTASKSTKPASTKASQTTKKPASTKASQTTQKSASTQASATSQNLASTQAGQTIQKPASTKEGQTTKKLATTKASRTTQKPASTKASQAIQKPASTQASQTTQKSGSKKTPQSATIGKDKNSNAVVNLSKTAKSAIKKLKARNGTAVAPPVQADKETANNPHTGNEFLICTTVITNKNAKVISSTGKGSNQKNKLTLNSLIRTSGQSTGRKVIKLPKTGKSLFLGQSYGVTDQESNAVSDITIDKIRDEYKDTNIDLSSLDGLLAYLLHGLNIPQVSSGKSQSSGCAPQDTYVNYVYEYDIQNQVFNSSFQDPNSIVIQRLQSNIADWTAEEIYKRNLVSYVTDDARLTKIIDVSNQYNNQATLRFYISINVSKNLIPVMRRIFETVGQKLQNQCFSTSNKKVDWGNMVLIPIQK